MNKESSDPQDKLVALKAAFASRLPDKIQEIEDAASGPLEGVLALAHKLAGSAGTYGFGALGNAARNLEVACQETLDQPGVPTDSDLKHLQTCVDVLRKSLPGEIDGIDSSPQTPPESPPLAPVSKGEIPVERGAEGKLLILVDDDVEQSAIQCQLLSNFGFSVRVLAHPSELGRAISEHPPAAVLMDIKFPGDDDAGLTTINELRDQGVLTCPVVFVSTRDDFEARLSAVRSGGDGYVVKPVNILELVDTVERLTEADRGPLYRVMIVDDDSEIAQYCQTVLEDHGLVTTWVDSPILALEVVSKFNPDVIIMDIEMPGCNGFELATAIRQMGDKFVQVPIVFLTAHSDIQNKMRAARAGSEDFVTKPVNAELLVASVMARAERSQMLELLYQRVKAGEERFTSIAQTAIDAIISINERGLILFWNKSAQEMFGYEHRDILGKPVTMLMPERYRQGYQDGLRRICDGGQNTIIGTTVELDGLRRDGSEFPIELSLSSWETGEHKFFAANIRDITRRKEMDDYLRRQNWVSEEAEQVANYGHWMWDEINDVSLHCSVGLARLRGMEVDEYVARMQKPDNKQARVHVDDLELLQNVWSGMRADARPYSVEYRFVHTNGDIRWVREVGSPMDISADGQVQTSVGITYDITDRKRTEEAVKAQTDLENLLRETADVANTAVSFEDAVRSCLIPICRHTKWPIGHVYLLSDENHDLLIPSDIWYLDDASRFKPFVDETRKTTFQRGIGLPGRVLANSAPAWISDATDDPNFPRSKQLHDTVVRGAFAFPVIANDEVVAILEFFDEKVDEPDEALLSTAVHIGDQLGRVYEREKAEIALAKARDELEIRVVERTRELQIAMTEAENASRAKSEFLAVMSHELRTPLNAISGFSEMIGGEYFGALGSEKYKEYATDIQSSSAHLLQLVNDILDLSAIEAGAQNLIMEDMNVGDVISECSMFVADATESGQIEFSVNVPEALPPLHADRRAMRQTILNLLSNAVKFTPPGGSIKLEVEPTEKNHIIRVIDTGVGIPAEKIPTLTDPFVRGEPDPHKAQPGIGLGLAIVKSLLEAHNGTLKIESECGTGTVVTISLPVISS